MSPISFFFLFNTLSTGTIYTVVGRVSNKKQPCVYGFIRLEFLFSPKLLLEKLQLQGMVSELLVSPFQLGAGICTVFWIDLPPGGEKEGVVKSPAGSIQVRQ